MRTRASDPEQIRGERQPTFLMFLLLFAMTGTQWVENVPGHDEEGKQQEPAVLTAQRPEFITDIQSLPKNKWDGSICDHDKRANQKQPAFRAG